MSTVKITELSQITVSTNTANTLLLGVDLPGDITGKLTVQSLSEGIYRNNPLNVGVSPITLPNTIGQFVSSSNNYIQVNLQNTDEEGTADYVVTANAGGDTYYYIDMGYTNINYNPLNANNSLGTSAYPLDGYLYVQGDGPGTLGGNLIIGTTTPDREVVLISGGINFENVAARITSTGLDLNFGKVLTFADDTVQSTAASPVAYSQASFALANTANAYAYNANTFLQANTGAALAASKVYTDTANTSLRLYSEANTGAALAVSKAYTDTANIYLSALNLSTSQNLNSTYIIASRSANTFIGTSGSSNPVNGITTFNSSNGITISGSGNTVTFNTPQNIQTNASPTFSGLTLSNALNITQGGTSSNTAVGALTNLLPSASGVTAGSILATNGPGTYYWTTGTTIRLYTLSTFVSPLAWNSNNYDQYISTSQSNSLTISADAGTPTDGRKVIFRIKDNGTARSLSWTTGVSKGFREVGITLPTTTIVNKTVYVGCIYNALDDRWDAIGISQEN